MKVSDDLEVEVQSHTNNAWYKAWVIDIYHTTALCFFGWKPEQKVPFMRIRQPPKYQVNHQYSTYEEVEVLSPEEPRGWWPAVVEQVSSDRRNFSIKYICSGRTPFAADGEGVVLNNKYMSDLDCKDIVGRDRIRPLTKSVPIHADMFYKHVVEVSDKLREHADIVLDEKAFAKFKEDTGASLIRYDKASNKVVIMTPHKSVLKDVQSCIDFQLTKQEQKVEMLQRDKRYKERQRESTSLGHFTAAPATKTPVPGVTGAAAAAALKQPTRQQFTEKFTVSPNFMGLAIGVRGKTINEARKIPGILALDLNEEICTFTITGESREAVTKARDHLEHGEMVIKMGQDVTPRIIGKGGTEIRKIIESANLVRVKVDPILNSDDTKFTFIGTLKSLRHAKILVNCQINHIQEMMEFSKTEAEVQKQLRLQKPIAQTLNQNAVLMTPRAPITPPFPGEDEEKVKMTPSCPMPPSYMQQNGSKYSSLPQMERLILDPEDQAGRHKEHETRQLLREQQQQQIEQLQHREQLQQHESRQLTTERESGGERVPLQQQQQQRTGVLREHQPRETYRTRDPARSSSRLSSGSRSAAAAPLSQRSSSNPTRTNSVKTQKPKVDIKLVNEKIGSALANDKVRPQRSAEDVRSEQQAAIEDLIKAEAVSSPINSPEKEENKENQQVAVNNQNAGLPDNNATAKSATTTTFENDNILKRPAQTTVVDEVREFSHSS